MRTLFDDAKGAEQARQVLKKIDANRPIQFVMKDAQQPYFVMTDEQFKQKMAIDQANRISDAKDTAEGLGILFLVGAVVVLFLSLALLNTRPYYYYRRWYWY